MKAEQMVVRMIRELKSVQRVERRERRSSCPSYFTALFFLTFSVREPNFELR